MTPKRQMWGGFILFCVAFFVAVTGLKDHSTMPSAVAYGAMGLAWASFLYAMYVFYFVITRGDKHLLNSGIKGTAVVLSAKQTNALAQTGQFEFAAPYIWDYKLRVTIPGRQPYEAKCSIARDGISEGSTVNVVVSRHNRKNVMIDFAQAPSAGGRAARVAAAGLAGTGSQPGGRVQLNVDPTALERLGKLTAAGAKPDPADELSKLADLRDRGVLSQAEFDAQKAKLLAAD